jgi:Glycosyl transferase family 2
MKRQLAPFEFVQVPYGRSRPIDFGRSHFYAQHLDEDELRQFVGKATTGRSNLCKISQAADTSRLSSMVNSPPAQLMETCAALQRELDVWSRAGMTARFWWRDDDAAADTPELRRLLGLARDTGLVVALATIPERADDTLARLASDAPCCIWQHGYRHHWRHEQGGERYTDGEFGEGRVLQAMVADAQQGQLALDQVFGPDGWQRVFVPPFHALSVSFKALIPTLGYCGVSAGSPLTPRIAPIPEVNADIDIMNWPARKFWGDDAVIEEIVQQLRLRRTGGLPPEQPIGLLTHHPVLEDDAWRFLERLFHILRSHDAVEFVPADKLFRHSSAAPAQSRVLSESWGRPAVEHPDEVTVVITSCGRQDLLEATLDSFWKHNTFPIRRFIVIEDGDGSKNQLLREKYYRMPITWLATGHRVGQIMAIDTAYSEIATEYIFHCEDDWEFTAPGFLEKSLSILKHDPQILQVWLRALDDTNRQPVFDHLFEPEDAPPYKMLRHHHDAGEWGVWHGFSWNPGLRRRREYDLIGTFTSLDPNGTKHTWEVESCASEFYQKRGFFAAVLADNGGKGYVRHVGGGRRVPRLPIARDGTAVVAQR